MQPAPQDNQLMSKHRVLSLKPQLRLEWRGQDGQSETEQPDHSASLGDSIRSSTRIRFSVHTTISFHPKSITDLRSGAKERCSRREAQRSTFARFFGLFDFRLLQQYLPQAAVSICSKLHRYSITSSARARSDGGISRPSALARIKLMTKSNLVDCITGRSVGLAPWSMRPA